MGLVSNILGPHAKLETLIKAVLWITAVRLGWLIINSNDVSLYLVRALLPWPAGFYSWTVWTADLALSLMQARAFLRLGRQLLILKMPALSEAWGLFPTSTEQTPTPRNRSWLPTALMLCGVLIITCCMAVWIFLMFRYGQWVAFDYFMSAYFSQIPFYVGAGLSLLAFMFGGRYIARASGDIATAFNVTTVDDDHWLAKRVHRIAEQLKLPLPAVGVTNVTNAFAMGASQRGAMVVIGKPLFSLQEDELDAIIGHELGHILHNDVARMQFAEGFQQALNKTISTFTVIVAVIAAQQARTRANARLGFELSHAAGNLFRHTVFIGSEMVVKGISRSREYHADAIGAHVTSADAMIRALERVHAVAPAPSPGERQYGYLMFQSSRLSLLFSTHPTLEARVRSLKGYGSETPPPPSSLNISGTDDEATAVAAESALERALLNATTGKLSLVNPLPFKADPFRIKFKTLPWRVIARWSAGLAVLVVVMPAVANYYEINRHTQGMASTISSTTASVLSSASTLIDKPRAYLSDVFSSDAKTELARLQKQLQFSNERLATSEKELKSAQAALTVLNTSKRQAEDRVRDMQADLARQRTLHAAELVAVAPSYQTSEHDAAFAALKVDRAQLEARVAEQEKLLSRLQASNPVQSDGGGRESSSLRIDLAAARRENAALVNEKMEMNKRLLEQTETISSFATGQTERDNRIRELEQQIALETISTEENDHNFERSNMSVPRFGAFAADGNGTVVLTEIDFATAGDASLDAKRTCMKFGGRNCIVHSTVQDSCAAIARVFPAGKGTAWAVQAGATAAEAARRAKRSCESTYGRECQVTREVCPS